MGYVLAANVTASNFRTPGGPKTATTAQLNAAIVPARIEACDVSFSLTGSYVQGTGMQITTAQIAAAIAAARRDGATYTVLSAIASGAGLEGSGAASGFVMPGPGTAGTGGLTLSGGNITGLLFGSDLATEHSAVTMLPFQESITLDVVYLWQQPGI